MTDITSTPDPRTMSKPPKPSALNNAGGGLSFLYQRETRQIIYQVLLAAALIWFFYSIITNTIANLKARGIASGFGFLSTTASFDISQPWFGYSATSSYGLAFLVGLVNTLTVAAIGIFFATILGFAMGIARLSKNWLIARVATLYIEIVRNLPLLLQLLFWYGVVLAALPQVRQSASMFDTAFLNNRGLYIPKAIWLPGSGLVFAAIATAVLGAIAVAIYGNKRQLATGKRPPVLWMNLGLLIGLPLITYLVAGRPLDWDFPKLEGFNFSGGLNLQPEWLALTVGLIVYTGAFIAEIVRAGIAGVPKGQTEAALAIGLQPSQARRLIIVPQAARIIVPPLTSQFLNLTKNSSLASSIGFQELYSVGGTINNQTGQAVEVVLMLIAVYLTLSLLTSVFMNWFNKRMALVER
jgi:general L-amino acid transport system permease protein